MVVEAVLERVPAVVERVQRELVLARFIGKLAVDQGVRELRERVESLTAATAPAATRPPSTPFRPDPDEQRDEQCDLDPLPGEAPAAGDLALADYDELPASNIVSKLASLEPAERELIAAYERAHRNRRTVLGKIAQLDDRGDAP